MPKGKKPIEDSIEAQIEKILDTANRNLEFTRMKMQSSTRGEITETRVAAIAAEAASTIMGPTHDAIRVLARAIAAAQGDK